MHPSPFYLSNNKMNKKRIFLTIPSPYGSLPDLSGSSNLKTFLSKYLFVVHFQYEGSMPFYITPFHLGTLDFQTEVVQSTLLIVCNGWEIEPLDMLNGLAQDCYQLSPEV